MSMTVWVWRILPRCTVENDLASGIQTTENAAKRAAAIAIRDTDGFVAMICQLGFDSGQWTPFTKPSIGMLTAQGSIRWLDSS